MTTEKILCISQGKFRFKIDYVNANDLGYFAMTHLIFPFESDNDRSFFITEKQYWDIKEQLER